MCGILGFTYNDSAKLKKGLNALAHRGPDGEGVFERSDISLGHRRLSIIDLSSLSAQPMVKEDGKFALVFNGEIYNYEALRADLEAKGAHFESQGDTEVILEGYRLEGAAFFQKLRGMWAVVIYDEGKQTLTLARDYFGIKPLYYAVDGNHNLSFASELKAFRHFLPSLSPNKKSYYQLWSLGYFTAPATCYHEVLALEPGNVMTWDLKHKKEKERFSLDWQKVAVDPVLLTWEESVSYLEDLLLDSVRAHFVADVPVGLLLSGGTDSSLLAALAKKAGFSPQAYHLAIKGSEDNDFAPRVAKALNLEFLPVMMGEKELEDHYEETLALMDSPTGDLSLLPTSLIYKMVGGKTKVVLSGEGGDELFSGYLRHLHLNRLASIKESSVWEKRLDKLQGTGAGAFHFLNPLRGRVQQKLITLGLENNLTEAYWQAAGIINETELAGQAKKFLWHFYQLQKNNFVLPPSLFFDLSLYLPGDLLPKGDISSMAYAVEGRVPFLDKVLLEGLLSKIPNDYLLSAKGRGKPLLKSVLSRLLEPSLVERSKKGFSFSVKRYYGESLQKDFQKAVDFHLAQAENFGLAGTRLAALLRQNQSAEVFRKFPRFAFAMITSYKLFR